MIHRDKGGQLTSTLMQLQICSGRTNVALLWPKPWMSWSAGSFAYAGRTERVVSVIRGYSIPRHPILRLLSLTRYYAIRFLVAIWL